MIAGMSLSYKSRAATGPRIIPADVNTALDNCHWVVPNPSLHLDRCDHAAGSSDCQG